MCNTCRNCPTLYGSNRVSSDPKLAPSLHPTLTDLAWAAGIYEGEGSTDINAAAIRVTVTQKDPWLLHRLRQFFGGSVRIEQRATLYRGTYRAIGRWYLRGARARGFLLTVFSWLSPRRRTQARKVLCA